MLTLEELIENDTFQSNIWIEKIRQFNDLKSFIGNFNYYHLLLAIQGIKANNVIDVKHHFFVSAFIDELQINRFNSRLLDYGFRSISYVLLSDNEALIQRYAKLRYQRGVNAELSMDEMVAIGEIPIWCNTVQFFMANDNIGVERNLNIIETKTLPKIPKKEEGLKDDYEFYKALHTEDKAKMEEVLAKLVSPKIHKKRNDNPILNQYISLPALGYAKLAWRKGIEVEVNSPLVPKDLLPIKPLDNYEIPYDFLKENI
ncbi:immunity 49 family protein [Flavobacterium frigoris]|uniref:Immunity protein 49 n=1 Tax=Flavobacterium frigoris TaxID=229204 RepID=A0A1H9S0J9_FLAFI|nr:immunity 49 family protein [Flavobacterium frigoris]SER78562.1 Immunity protein 49 [Flavobacterium frigoris]